MGLYKKFSGKGGLTARWARTGLPGSRIAATANKALSIASKVASVLNVEQKNVDGYASDTYGLSSYSTYLLNPIAQGDGGNQRDGDQVKIMRTYGSIMCYNNTGDPQWVRILILRDRQADGTVPTLAEVLELSSSEPHYLAKYNMNGKFRFKIYHDKLMCLGNSPADGKNVKVHKFFTNFIAKHKAKLKRKPFQEGIRVRYSGTGGTSSDIASNSLWCFVIFPGAGADIGSEIVYRTRYVDN